MTRRLPIAPTIIVLAAVATMVALGFWQLARKGEKEALLSSYARAQAMSSEVAWPRAGQDTSRALYRYVRLDCVRVENMAAVAGRSRDGRAGWAHVARCRLPDGSIASVAIGWSDRPESRQWQGGTVDGLVGPAGKDIRLVSIQGLAGLAPLAPPNPADIPNNHLAYAVQWFLFAGTALAIYALALRKRFRG